MTTNGPVSPGDLFVFYGLLKQGAAGMPAHIDLEAAGDFLGATRFRGAMHDLGGFPGVVGGDTLCHGVRYRIRDAAVASALDAFEDVLPGDPDSSLYQRTCIALLDESGTETGEAAWIYTYNQPIQGQRRLNDGDWPLTAGRPRT